MIEQDLQALGERLAVIEARDARMEALLLQLVASLPSPLVSVAEAAERAAVSIATMRRWIATGDVRVVRRGHSVRVDLTSLQPANDERVADLARKARG